MNVFTSDTNFTGDNIYIKGNIVSSLLAFSGLNINLNRDGVPVSNWLLTVDGSPNSGNLDLACKDIGTGLTTGYYSFSTNGAPVFYSQQLSDIKLKNNITDIEPSLEKLLKLKPSYFKYKNFDDSKREVSNENNETFNGFIAQNVEDFFPICVTENEHRILHETVKNISITNLIPYIVKSIQEQNILIKNLQKEIEDIKNAISV